MITFDGKYYDGKTSGQTEVVCKVYDSGALHVERAEGDARITALMLSELTISPRLAGTPRYLRFPGGEKLETEDNDTVDEIIKKFGKRSWLDMVHRFESRLKYVAVGLVCLVVLIWASIQYGIPMTARVIADRLPVSVLDMASKQTIAMLDRSVFKPSELDEDTRTRLEKHFQPLVADHGDYPLKVMFRKGGPLGPNAFALPDGTIVFTDEMVRLAENDDELAAVLAHEIGHVARRHGLRTIIQDSLLGFLLLGVTGDVTGSSELFLGLPVILTDMAYSRDFEREADQYALAYMQTHGMDLDHFANLMRRLEMETGRDDDDDTHKWTNYLSTHPMTEERLKAFE